VTIPQITEPLDDDAFDMQFGRWLPITPWRVRELLSGFTAPWWICGGWAIELHTGITRRHHDLDLLIRCDDLSSLRAHLHRHGLVPWINRDDVYHALADDAAPDDGCRQLWLRRDDGPWWIDLCLADTCDDRWLCKRDRTITRAIDDIGLRTPDGIPYLRPEIALLFKAATDAPRNARDFSAALRRLNETERRWLHEAVRRVHGDAHPWLSGLM
jgi:hypothetical protein